MLASWQSPAGTAQHDQGASVSFPSFEIHWWFSHPSLPTFSPAIARFYLPVIFIPLKTWQHQQHYSCSTMLLHHISSQIKVGSTHFSPWETHHGFWGCCSSTHTLELLFSITNPDDRLSVCGFCVFLTLKSCSWCIRVAVRISPCSFLLF